MLLPSSVTPIHQRHGILVWAVLLCLIRAVQGSNVTVLQIAEATLEPEDRFHEALATEFEGSGFLDLIKLEFSVPQQLDMKSETSFVDIALVPLSEHCFVSQVGGDCNWSTSMGIGYLTDAEAPAPPDDATTTPPQQQPLYCCLQKAMELGFCTAEQYGRLLINWDLFKGKVRNVTVPGASSIEQDLAGAGESKVLLHVEGSPVMSIPKAGTYALLLANCNVEHGRTVTVAGETDWISYHDVYQTFFDENVPFYMILLICHAILLTWYGCLMRKYAASRIRLEEWIVLTIGLGLLDVLFRFLQYSLRERAGGAATTARALMVLGSTVGSIKHGLSRCLLLMLSLGWGVVHPTLEPTTTALIITVTVVYCVLRAMLDILLGFGSTAPGTNGFRFIQFAGWSTLAIDLLFVICIPVALTKTMRYLSVSQQLRKLQRYRGLLKILILAVALTLILVGLIVWDYWLDGGQELTILNISQGNEVNFFLILTFVACLWKPNPMARDFAYAMELSMQEVDDDGNVIVDGNDGGGALGMGGREGYLTDLELTETSVVDNKRAMETTAAASATADDQSEDSTDYRDAAQSGVLS